MFTLSMGKIMNPGSRPFITIVGVALLFLMWGLTYMALPQAARDSIWFSFLLVCLGAVIGGLIGALASPGGSHEKDTFKTVAGVISAFLTGALWATFQSEIKQFVLYAVADPAAQTRSVSFLISVFLGGFVMYAFRAYGGSTTAKEVQRHFVETRKAIDELEKVVGKPLGQQQNE